jgi:DNA polymerase-3 subunit alpha
VHYTAEFYCGNMTVEMDNTDKLKVLYEDALKMGITFEMPDVNRGVPLRAGDRQGHTLRPGRHQGHGQAAIEAIVAARNGEGTGPNGHEKGRSRACSTSACAWTAAASTSARWKR